MLLNQIVQVEFARVLSGFATEALLEEVRLTPKPGLVDKDNNGSHHDLTLRLMEYSALSLENTFYEMALASAGQSPSQYLRERLAAIGRYGEQTMLQHTGQVNTHKGAIWILGLLTGAARIHLTIGNEEAITITGILATAGAIARFEDRYTPAGKTNGDGVRKRYLVRSAREEAIAGFPSLHETAIPTWNAFRHETETVRRLNVLLSLMSVVQDTCILHRSNMDILTNVQKEAGAIIRKGGLGISDNLDAYRSLDKYVNTHWVSPGGSADLLAATIFLHKIIYHYKN
jgi:triphosphoribosyl-dephospho-CoA synthase